MAFFKAYFVSDNCTFIWVRSDQVWVMFQKNYKGLKGRQNSPKFVTKLRFFKADFVSDNCAVLLGVGPKRMGPVPWSEWSVPEKLLLQARSQSIIS